MGVGVRDSSLGSGASGVGWVSLSGVSGVGWVSLSGVSGGVWVGVCEWGCVSGGGWAGLSGVSGGGWVGQSGGGWRWGSLPIGWGVGVGESAYRVGGWGWGSLPIRWGSLPMGWGCESGDQTNGHLQTVTGDQMITLRILVHKLFPIQGRSFHLKIHLLIYCVFVSIHLMSQSTIQ